MPGLLPDVDPEGLLEYSVVYTDRALNHMSQSFQAVMRDISDILRRAYGADAVAVVFEDYFICDQISGIRSLYNDVISKYK